MLVKEKSNKTIIKRGKIRNTGVAVADILYCIAQGMTVKQILVRYPDISREDIMFCLAS